MNEESSCWRACRGLSSTTFSRRSRRRTKSSGPTKGAMASVKKVFNL